MLKNKLKPFYPEDNLKLSIQKAEQIVAPSRYDSFGFSTASKQARFFESQQLNRIVVMTYTGARPGNIADTNVVCRLFGTLSRESLTLWHFSANPAHPYNDNKKGERWGVFNVEPYKNKSGKTRWKGADGKNVTQTKAGAHICGSPNPYVIELMARTVDLLNLHAIEQHSDMPCARLFNSEYDHKTHPAIYLVYKTLDFTNVMGHFVWYEEHNKPILRSFLRAVQLIELGFPVV